MAGWVVARRGGGGQRVASNAGGKGTRLLRLRGINRGRTARWIRRGSPPPPAPPAPLNPLKAHHRLNPLHRVFSPLPRCLELGDVCGGAGGRVMHGCGNGCMLGAGISGACTRDTSHTQLAGEHPGQPHGRCGSAAAAALPPPPALLLPSPTNDEVHMLAGFAVGVHLPPSSPPPCLASTCLLHGSLGT